MNMSLIQVNATGSNLIKKLSYKFDKGQFYERMISGIHLVTKVII